VELVRINRDLNAALKGKQIGIEYCSRTKINGFYFMPLRRLCGGGKHQSRLDHAREQRLRHSGGARTFRRKERRRHEYDLNKKSEKQFSHAKFACAVKDFYEFLMFIQHTFLKIVSSSLL
jgi:hypothetical protein